MQSRSPSPPDSCSKNEVSIRVYNSVSRNLEQCLSGLKCTVFILLFFKMNTSKTNQAFYFAAQSQDSFREY